MSNTAALLFVPAIIYISQVTAVKISTSINPPTLEVGNSVTLKWIVTYENDEHLKHTALSVKKRNGEKFVEIANNLKGVTADRELLLELKATVTITLFTIEVKITNLEYSDEFHFKGLASGATFHKKSIEVNEILSVNDVKGKKKKTSESLICFSKLVLAIIIILIFITFCGICKYGQRSLLYISRKFNLRSKGTK